MISIIQTFIPYAVLVSHPIFLVLFSALVFRRSWGRTIANVVGKNAVLLGFIIALASISGSLFYSELVGYEPCVLCWWQRVFLYPQVIIFGVALWRKKSDVFAYSVPLVTLSALLALYHQYVYMGGASLLPCTALGGACAKIYVMEFGYITIPMMSLTAAAFFLLLAWAHRIYVKENRNS